MKSIFHYFERAFSEVDKNKFFGRWEPDFKESLGQFLQNWRAFKDMSTEQDRARNFRKKIVFVLWRFFYF